MFDHYNRKANLVRPMEDHLAKIAAVQLSNKKDRLIWFVSNMNHEVKNLKSHEEIENWVKLK